jgi:two-component sensor histidine kinase
MSRLAEFLELLAAGQIPEELPEDCECRGELGALVEYLTELSQFAGAMAAGDLSATMKRSGLLAGSLKSLHANLRHLTWQTQQIAAGDFGHRVDFLGEFSIAFNRMVAALAKAREGLVEKNTELAEINASLSAEVAERKRAEEREKTAVLEKATLLKELQHRVKNSISIISSLVRIEEREAASPEAKAILVKLESRTEALASLYDILYATGSIEKIGLGGYLGSVIDFAAESLGADAKSIAFDRDIEPITIDLKRAIAIGLVLNELVTDSVKHAFPAGRGGRIMVRLAREGNELVLMIEDDGVGLPFDFEPSRGKGYGMTIVGALAMQLNAEFTARSEGGARFVLRMPA